MKMKISKPMFVTFQRPHDNYWAAINVDDLKQVIVNHGNKSVDVKVSNHEITLGVNSTQIQRLESEISSRYNTVTINNGEITVDRSDSAYSSVIRLVTPDTSTYIWPRAFSMIKVEDLRISISVYGNDSDTVLFLNDVPTATSIAEIFGLLNVV